MSRLARNLADYLLILKYFGKHGDRKKKQDEVVRRRHWRKRESGQENSRPLELGLSRIFGVRVGENDQGHEDQQLNYG